MSAAAMTRNEFLITFALACCAALSAYDLYLDMQEDARKEKERIAIYCARPGHSEAYCQDK